MSNIYHGIFYRQVCLLATDKKKTTIKQKKNNLPPASIFLKSGLRTQKYFCVAILQLKQSSLALELMGKSNQGNKGYSGNQKNVSQGQRPDMENRHTQQRT